MITRASTYPAARALMPNAIAYASSNALNSTQFGTYRAYPTGNGALSGIWHRQAQRAPSSSMETGQ